jgi:multiple sugar transport system permease protein
MKKHARKGISSKRREALAAYGFLAPNFLGFLAFTSIPVIISLVMSFTHWNIFKSPTFLGIDNFYNLLWFHREHGRLVPNDPFFWQYVYNTVFLMIGIPIGMAGSLIVALTMNRKLRGIVVYRTVYFLPSVCSGVALLILWKYLYNSDIGFINTFLRTIGIANPPDWLGATFWAKPALMLMGLWGGLGGYNMILYLAALQGVPSSYYEAAEIDGAGPWAKFWSITWPMISPTTFFILIMSIIGGFQSGFMTANVMTGGGPAGSTTTIEYYLYQTAFEKFNMGYASAVAWFLFAVILVLTLAAWKLGGRVVTYE